MRFSTFFEYPNLDEQEKSDDLTFLGECSEEEWDKIVAQTQRRKFKAGETIVSEGDADRSLYIVASGTLEARVRRHKGVRTRVTTIKRGSVFGEQAFLDGKPRSANVVAVSDGELLVLTLDSLKTLVGWEPKLATQILFDLGRILSLRLRQTTLLISKWAG
ncbi:MAG: cyclic nucleotide-binding domain-containing protein [Gammaproteobacteria bacterium]|nr:cyclic nucleotide-binding domain-containing protein [Gammaproteobacteria bacterium]